MMSTHRSACGGSSTAVSLSVSMAILIAAIGVRSSWLALATKSVFICTAFAIPVTSRSTSSDPPVAVWAAKLWYVRRCPYRTSRTSE